MRKEKGDKKKVDDLDSLLDVENVLMEFFIEDFKEWCVEIFVIFENNLVVILGEKEFKKKKKKWKGKKVLYCKWKDFEELEDDVEGKIN